MSDWNDDKLDHLDRRVDEGFKRMDKQFAKGDERFERIDQRLAKTPTREEMNQGFGELRQEMTQGFGELRSEIGQTQTMILALNRTLIAGAIAVAVALIGIIGALLA